MQVAVMPRVDPSQRSCQSIPNQNHRNAAWEVEEGRSYYLESWKAHPDRLAAEESGSHGHFEIVVAAGHLVSKSQESGMSLSQALASGQLSSSLSYLHWIYLGLHLSKAEDLLYPALEAQGGHSRGCWQHLLP